MQPLYLTCPRTGRRVDTGVTIDRASLADYTPRNGRTFCVHCANTHPWNRDTLVLEDSSILLDEPPVSMDAGAPPPQ